MIEPLLPLKALLQVLDYYSIGDLRLICAKYQNDIVDFRVPLVGDEIPSTSPPFERIEIIAPLAYPLTPRLILRPRKKVTRKRIILEQLKDYPRQLKKGEVGIDPYSNIHYVQTEENEWVGPHVPYSQREETFEVFVD